MRRIKKVALFGAVLALLAAASFSLLVHPEPVYQGKRLSLWLEEFDSRDERTSFAAQEAIRQLGTNAIPQLVESLFSKDSPLQDKFKNLFEKQSFLKWRFTAASEREMRSLMALRILGPCAKASLPALTNYLMTSERSGNAIPVVLAIDPDTGFPPLIKALEEGDSTGRRIAADMLGLAGEQAKMAIPALQKALRDQDSKVRVAAKNALKKIDPGAAAKAGVK